MTVLTAYRPTSKKIRIETKFYWGKKPTREDLQTHFQENKD